MPGNDQWEQYADKGSDPWEQYAEPAKDLRSPAGLKAAGLMSQNATAPELPKPQYTASGSIGESEEANAAGMAELGKDYAKAGPGEIGGGVSDIAHGNVGHGIHRVVKGAGVTSIPAAANLLPMGLMTAPAATLGAAAGGAIGTPVAKYGAKALGANEDWSDVAGDAGGLTGSVIGGATTQGAKLLGEALMGRNRLSYEPAKSISLPWYVGGGRIVRNTPEPPALPPPEPNVQSLSEGPSYPKILAGRANARAEARAGLSPGLLAPEPNVQSLSEGPSYPKILAGRANARAEARAGLSPGLLAPKPKLGSPENPGFSGTPTNAIANFDAPLPPAPPQGTAIGPPITSTGAQATFLREVPHGAMPPPEPNVQSLSEGPSYPKILAGRANARAEARAGLSPGLLAHKPKLGSPENPGFSGTPTNAIANFDAPLPPAPPQGTAIGPPITSTGAQATFLREVPHGAIQSTPEAEGPIGSNPAERRIQATASKAIITPEEYARSVKDLGSRARMLPGEGEAEWRARITGLLKAARPRT